MSAHRQESRSREVKMTKMVKVKENALDAEIQITSSKNAQSHQEAKNQRPFVGGIWSDNGEDEEEKTKDETCLVAQATNVVLFETEFYSDSLSSIDDSGSKLIKEVLRSLKSRSEAKKPSLEETRVDV
ncbi:hypothetical protein Tco_0669446 [Tanacetum coccineum]